MAHKNEAANLGICLMLLNYHKDYNTSLFSTELALLHLGLLLLIFSPWNVQFVIVWCQLSFEDDQKFFKFSPLLQIGLKKKKKKQGKEKESTPYIWSYPECGLCASLCRKNRVGPWGLKPGCSLFSGNPLVCHCLVFSGYLPAKQYPGEIMHKMFSRKIAQHLLGTG